MQPLYLRTSKTAICFFWLRIFLPSKIFEKSPGYQLGEAYLTLEEQKHLPPSLGCSVVFSYSPSCSPWFPGLTVPTHMLREQPASLHLKVSSQPCPAFPSECCILAMIPELPLSWLFWPRQIQPMLGPVGSLQYWVPGKG